MIRNVFVFLLILINISFIQSADVKYSKPTLNEIKTIPKFIPTESNPLPKSYAGILPVRKGDDRLFYWYFPKQSSSDTDERRDLLVMLNRGPACYFAEMLFLENGVFQIDANQVVSLNSKSFHQFSHVLYIDSPLGTGFSQFSTELSDFESYGKSKFPGNSLRQKTVFPGATKYVVQDLQDSLIQFFTLFPNLSPEKKGNTLNFYTPGYSAKMIPYFIKENSASGSFSQKFKISSVILGDPFLQPSLQYASYAKFGYVSGLTMYRQFVEMNRKYEQCLTDVENGDYKNYDKECHSLIAGLLENSGNVSPFDIREQSTQQYEQRQSLLNSYVNSELLPALRTFGNIISGVTAIPHCSKKVNDLFHEEYHLDVPQDVFPSILNTKTAINSFYNTSNVRILVFSQQFNLVSNVFGVSEILRQMLDWEGQLTFNSLNSTVFTIQDMVGGRFKSFGGLTQVVLYNNNYKEGVEVNPNFNGNYKLGNVDMVDSRFEMVKRYITRPDTSMMVDDRDLLCSDTTKKCHSDSQYPCPSMCSKKGTCNTEKRKCDCQAGYYDNDCSVGRAKYSLDILTNSISFPNLYINGRDTIVLEVNIQERTSLLDIYLEVNRVGKYGTPFVFMNVSTTAQASTSRELKLLAMKQIGYNLLNGYKSTRSEAQSSHEHYFYTGYKTFQFYNTSHDSKKVIDAQDVHILRNEYQTIAIVIYNAADLPVEFNVTLKANLAIGKVQTAGIFLSLSVVVAMVIVFEIVLLVQRSNNRKQFILPKLKEKQDAQRRGLLENNSSLMDEDEFSSSDANQDVELRQRN